MINRTSMINRKAFPWATPSSWGPAPKKVKERIRAAIYPNAPALEAPHRKTTIIIRMTSIGIIARKKCIKYFCRIDSRRE
jgi:hypothetical protein